MNHIAVQLFNFELGKRCPQSLLWILELIHPKLGYHKQIISNKLAFIRGKCALNSLSNQLFIFVDGSAIEQAIPTLNNSIVENLRMLLRVNQFVRA